jgi:hypothetical protein
MTGLSPWSVAAEGSESEVLEMTESGAGLGLPSILRFGKLMLGEGDTCVRSGGVPRGLAVLLPVENVRAPAFAALID